MSDDVPGSRSGSLGSSAQFSRDLRLAAAGPLALQVSSKYLDEHCVLPLAVDEDGALLVAVGGPLDAGVAGELSQTYGRRLKLVEAPAAEIQAAILSAQSNVGVRIEGTEAGATDAGTPGSEEGALDDLRALASQAPVIKLVNVILLEALRVRASDVHLESTEDGLRVRYRIDGVLQEISRPSRQFQAAVISRIKIMASLNIAERRLPQDGRIRLRLSDRELDLRVSTLPSLHGESVVLRVLDHGASARDLKEIGMSEPVRVTFERLIRLPHGIVLVTGPTGSGKTTTLYGGLRWINAPGVKILTVEDPVEYQVDGVTQIPINPKAGLTFAAALRSILRHDPDIIMVGEMRDRETSEIAVQAALTGHLVFSTLHTNDAPSGITRLVDMGVEPYLVAATVQGLLAQRLVRMVCPDCAERHRPPAEDLARVATLLGGVAGATEREGKPTYRRGRGCAACAGTGYQGRTGIYELLVLTDEIRTRIVSQAPLQEVRALALAQGMVPLRAAGWAKVRAGITTLEELFRVTQDESGS
jgi:type II secretion system protein E